jgi:flagellar basal body-associated protein FliL
MERKKKINISCAVVAALVIAGVVALLAWTYVSLERDPIKGWQEGPHVPHTPLKVHVTPYSTTSTPG